MNAQLKKALKHRFVVVSGTEPYLLKEFLDDLFVALDVPKDDFDVQLVSAESSKSDELVANVGMAPFLSERRIVIVRQSHRLATDEFNLAALKGLPESSLLILVIDEESMSDERKASTRKTAFAKLVKQVDGYLVELEVDPKALREMVRSKVAEAEKSITNPAFDLLIEMTGGKASLALQELEKVILFVNGTQITEREIASVVVPSREWNIWAMIDAMVRGDVTITMNHLKNALSGNSKIEEFVFPQLFPLVERQLKFLYQARLLIDNGGRVESLPDSIRSKFVGKPNLLTESDYRRGNIVRSANRISMTQIGKAFSVLAVADSRLKGSEPQFSALDSVERFIFELTDALRAKQV